MGEKANVFAVTKSYNFCGLIVFLVRLLYLIIPLLRRNSKMKEYIQIKGTAHQRYCENAESFSWREQ